MINAVEKFDYSHIETLDIRPIDAHALKGLDLFELLEGYLSAGPLLSLIVNGECIAIVGLCVLWNGVGEIYMVTGEGVERNKIFFCKTLRRLLDEYAQKNNLHRVQCVVHEKNARSFIWLEKFFGFKYEGIMFGYGPDKSDYYRMAKTWDL